MKDYVARLITMISIMVILLAGWLGYSIGAATPASADVVTTSSSAPIPAKLTDSAVPGTPGPSVPGVTFSIKAKFCGPWMGDGSTVSDIDLFHVTLPHEKIVCGYYATVHTATGAEGPYGKILFADNRSLVFADGYNRFFQGGANKLISVSATKAVLQYAITAYHGAGVWINLDQVTITKNSDGTWTVAQNIMSYPTGIPFEVQPEPVILPSDKVFLAAEESAAPSITVQPSDVTKNVGETATFSVAATGTAPLTYQWYKNSVEIPSATDASYTTGVLSITDNGALFSVTVSNSAGKVNSRQAKLTVVDVPTGVSPTITAQPADTTVFDGGTATFTVTATGTTPLSYQWMKNDVAIAGATSATYNTPVVHLADSGTKYSVSVSNVVGSVSSTKAALIVKAIAPAISVQPTDQSKKVGETATFSVTATGTAPLSYQWKKNGTAISGATAVSYTTPVLVFSDSGSLYSVTVSNAGGTITSRSATLTIAEAAPTITKQPVDALVNLTSGTATATFTVTATPVSGLKFQVKQKLLGSTTFTDFVPRSATDLTISGGTATLRIAPVTPNSIGNQYYFVVSNAAGSVTSNTVSIKSL